MLQLYGLYSSLCCDLVYDLRVKAQPHHLDYHLRTDLTEELFTADWPFYTKTTDSCPAHYFEGCKVKNSMVANGSLVEGSIENCVVGRNVKIGKGAVLKNCVVLAQAVIGEGVHIENQVIDKWAEVKNVKKIVADADKPGYIRRNDKL